MNSKKSIAKLDFQLNQLVFAKQKGHIHWPGIITDFHSNRPRCAKIEFFGWNSQWAFVSFDNLLTTINGQKVVERNPNNLRFQKAVREMEIWTNGALSSIQKRTVEQESAERSKKSLHHSAVENENASHKNGLTNSDERFRRATRSSVLSKPLAEAPSSPHTMYACKTIPDSKKMIIRKSTEKRVVENSPSFRMTRSKARSTEYENLHLFENAQKVSVKRLLNEEDEENKKKKNVE